MHEPKARKSLYFLVAAACAVAAGTHAAQISTDQKLKQINSYCFDSKRASVDGRSCLAEQLQRTIKDLEAEVRRRDFEIDEVARKPKAPLELSGREAAEAWRSAFKAEQDGWERYRQQRCQNVQDFESYPGNGAWSTQCSLRLTLERLRELKDGY